MACAYDYSSNMDDGIEWVSDYKSDQDTPSFPNGNSPIIGMSSKSQQTEFLMEMFSIPTLLLFSRIDILKRMQIIKRL